jgi:hypothetical protein
MKLPVGRSAYRPGRVCRPASRLAGKTNLHVIASWVPAGDARLWPLILPLAYRWQVVEWQRPMGLHRLDGEVAADIGHTRQFEQRSK